MIQGIYTIFPKLMAKSDDSSCYLYIETYRKLTAINFLSKDLIRLGGLGFLRQYTRRRFQHISDVNNEIFVRETAKFDGIAMLLLKFI